MRRKRLHLLEADLASEMLAIEQQAQTQMQSADTGGHQEGVQTNETPVDVIENAQQQIEEGLMPVDQTINNVIHPPKQEDAPETTQAESQDDTPSENMSPTKAILAGRNMLRSKKKALEQKNGKKPRETQKAASEEKVSFTPRDNVPDLETVPEKPFSAQDIDPANVKQANQVDKWANMIDAMGLGGRLRQLAIHAVIDESSTDDVLKLKLDEVTKHLVSDAAHEQLEQAISEFCQDRYLLKLNS